jgi:hypothetical protein
VGDRDFRVVADAPQNRLAPGDARPDIGQAVTSQCVSTESPATGPSLAAKPGAAGTRKSGETDTSLPQSNPVKPTKSGALPTDAKRRTGGEFGREGTNKTVAAPKPDNAPPDELGLGPHVDKTPYTRG